MREGWPIRTLGELSDISYGYTEKAVAEPIGPKFLRITDIQNDTVDWDAVPYCKIDDNDREKYRLVTGDIVFARTGATTGKSYMVSQPPDAVCASYLIRLRLQSSELFPKFVSYYFSTKAYWDAISIGISGSAQGGFNASKLGALQIPVPPLSEQQRIVAILDEAFAGLATATAYAETNLKNACELFESYLNSIFAQNDDSWTEVQLGDVCSISSSLVDPRERRFIDLPHLGAGNMSSKTGELSNIMTAREEGLKSGKFLFDETMVLYSKIRPYLMKACRPDFAGLCSADVYPLSPDPLKLDRNFLFHLLMSKDFTEFAISGSDRAGMPKVNRDHLFKYRVRVPSVGEQARLASKLDVMSAETMRLEAFYRKRLGDIAELKQALLGKAFSGKLTSTPSEAAREAAE